MQWAPWLVRPGDGLRLVCQSRPAGLRVRAIAARQKKRGRTSKTARPLGVIIRGRATGRIRTDNLAWVDARSSTLGRSHGSGRRSRCWSFGRITERLLRAIRRRLNA